MSGTTAEQTAKREAALNDPGLSARTELRLHKIQVYADMGRPSKTMLWKKLCFEIRYSVWEYNKARIAWWTIALEPSIRWSRYLIHKMRWLRRDVEECYRDAVVWIKKDTNRL